MGRRLFSAYFSLEGRLSRLAYWGRSFIAGLAVTLIIVTAVFVRPYSEILFAIIGMAALLIGVAAWISLMIRRFHDHGRTGWKGAIVAALAGAIASAGGAGLVWTPVATLAGVVSLALFAYLGFVRGERGPNRYGPDPLA